MEVCKSLEYQGPGLKLTGESRAMLPGFLESWILKSSTENTPEIFERFIYQWITVNAWASVAVQSPQKSTRDSYLVKRMAADLEMKDHFKDLYANNPEFKKKVSELFDHAPVFNASWMRNKNTSYSKKESREEFIQRMKELNPYDSSSPNAPRPKGYSQFAPFCAFKHLDKNESVPKDWPHAISMIYQVRCNLFHGGKNFDKQSDKKIIELASFILWEVWCKKERQMVDRAHKRASYNRNRSRSVDLKRIVSTRDIPPGGRRVWQGKAVDEKLKDEWLELFNNLQSMNLISICTGHLRANREATQPHINFRFKPEYCPPDQIEAILKNASLILTECMPQDLACFNLELRTTARDGRVDKHPVVLRICGKRRSSIQMQDWFEDIIEIIKQFDNKFLKNGVVG